MTHFNISSYDDRHNYRDYDMCANCHLRTVNPTNIIPDMSMSCTLCTLHFRNYEKGEGKLVKILNNRSYERKLLPNPRTDCPICDDPNLNSITLNDGGSILCNECNSMFHWCDKTTYVIGKPGPSSCSKCRPDLMSDF